MNPSTMKYALITGASRGIGKAIALQLASQGFHILLNFRSNKEAAEETARLIDQKGVTSKLLPFDVADRVAVEKALEDFQKNNPEAEIEVIVNNAGITRDGLFMWMKPEDWHSVIDTNLNGFYHVTRPLLKNMLSRRSGRIINVVSLSGLKGNAGQVNYSAAKGAVVAATKALAQEIGKRGITVNAVAPGFITSDMTADFNEKEIKKLIPLNRFGKAEEVASLVGFLVSENAGYITGEIININGGLYS